MLETEQLTQILERVATMEGLLKEFITSTRDILKDHETRIRSTEQKKEECHQDIRIGNLEGRLTKNEGKLNSHIDETKGHEKGTQYIRDSAMIAVAVVITWLITCGLNRL